MIFANIAEIVKSPQDIWVNLFRQLYLWYLSNEDFVLLVREHDFLPFEFFINGHINGDSDIFTLTVEGN